MVIVSRAPVRIDLAGAWTDVPAFSRGAGGAVVNATIDKYVEGRLEMAGDAAPEGEDDAGIRVSYRSNLPAGSGLGTSAALNVCWLSLVQRQVNPGSGARLKLAELAYDLEEMLGIVGGKQDQYAAALGGLNYLTFGDTVEVERLEPPAGMVEQLASQLVLCYTGRSRLSGDIHKHVWGAFRAGVPGTVDALYRLRDGAVRMRQAFLDGAVDEVGHLIGDSWTQQKALHPSVTNAQIEALVQTALDAGALCGKATGAGGGGCLLFFVGAGLKADVERALQQAGARVIPFRFEFDGLQVRSED